MLVSEVALYIVLALCGVVGVYGGIKSIKQGEYHGRYRFTSEKYCYSRRYEPETLIILTGGIFFLALDAWFLLR